MLKKGFDCWPFRKKENLFNAVRYIEDKHPGDHTGLDIKDTITPDSFIKLVLEWNETSSRIENKVQGIDWHGEHNVRYGSEGLWLEFVELAEWSILAVRHEKVTADGVTWDSDFVANFAERKQRI